MAKASLPVSAAGDEPEVRQALDPLGPLGVDPLASEGAQTQSASQVVVFQTKKSCVPEQQWRTVCSHNAVAWIQGWLARQGLDHSLVNGKNSIFASRVTEPDPGQYQHTISVRVLTEHVGSILKASGFDNVTTRQLLSPEERAHDENHCLVAWLDG